MVHDKQSRGEGECAFKVAVKLWLRFREVDAFQSCLAASSEQLSTTKRVWYLTKKEEKNIVKKCSRLLIYEKYTFFDVKRNKSLRVDQYAMEDNASCPPPLAPLPRRFEYLSGHRIVILSALCSNFSSNVDLTSWTVPAFINSSRPLLKTSYSYNESESKARIQRFYIHMI